jgi:hypothetical protein
MNWIRRSSERWLRAVKSRNRKKRKKRMAKGKTRLSSVQRQARTYRIIFVVISVIILLTMVLSLVAK